MKLKQWIDSLSPETKVAIIRFGFYPLLFLLMITPGLIYWTSPSLYNSGKHEWMMWFTITSASLFVAGGIGYFIIYKRIKEAIELKKWRKEHPAP